MGPHNHPLLAYCCRRRARKRPSTLRLSEALRPVSDLMIRANAFANVSFFLTAWNKKRRLAGSFVLIPTSTCPPGFLYDVERHSGIRRTTTLNSSSVRKRGPGLLTVRLPSISHRRDGLLVRYRKL